MNNNLKIPGGLKASKFLRDYWQKKPLLIRQAFPQFKGLLSPRQLLALACDEEAQTRLVTQRRGHWQLQHGPFAVGQFDKLGKDKWTVLLQGLNHTLPAAAELLHHFNFIPHARLDDLMVSYASPGGGVGPHFDSYDVFLLQGIGHRRWQISAQQDLSLVEDAPLKILRHFKPEQEWVLAPGDMLYLPPHYAHNGIAEDECMTYSIGFRAPACQELAEQFMVYMQDRVSLKGMYADPDLKLQQHPSEIGTAMLQQVEKIIRQVQWGKPDIADFTGCYLSEPKPHIYFDSPTKLISRTSFEKAVHRRGVALSLKSQMLCRNSTIFMNGLAFRVSKNAYAVLRVLADTRRIDADVKLEVEAMDLLYQWYADGYILFARK